MFVAIGMLAVNWFGDSLDGTVARVRHHERPRYGFYVDHVLDVVGILMLVGGFALGGFMSPLIAAGFLIAYYLLMVEIALATHAVGTFRISFWKFGPTELASCSRSARCSCCARRSSRIAGERVLLFDVGGAVAIAGLVATFLVSALKNGRHLYRLEPLPGRGAADTGDVKSSDDPGGGRRSALFLEDPHHSEAGGR